MPEFDQTKRRLTWTVYTTPPGLLTFTTDLGLSIRVFIFEIHEIGDWDIWVGPEFLSFILGWDQSSSDCVSQKPPFSVLFRNWTSEIGFEIGLEQGSLSSQGCQI